MPHSHFLAPSRSPMALAVRRALGLSLSGALLGAPLVALAQDEVVESDTVVVVGTALKVAAPLVETPRPVSTVQREELEERNVQSLDETFRYRAGVLAGHYGADNDTDWFKVRGFDQSTYQDGLRIYRTGYYQWLPEPYGLESVDVFKGPSSILYGEAPAGGLINAVSKRPTSEPRGEVNLQVGNRQHRQLGVDTSGPLTESGDVRYRMVGMVKERDGDLDHTENERYYFAPSLEVDFSEDTSVTFLASIQKDDAIPTNPFKLTYGTVEDTPFGKVDPQTSYGEPDYDTNERTQASLGYELRHQLNDTWRFEQNLRYSHLDMDLRSTYISARQPGSDRLATRGLVYRDGEIDSWTMDNRLIGKWYTDRTENTLMIGLGYQDLGLEGKEADLFTFGDPIDIFDPQYGNYTPVTEDQLIEREIDKQQTGLYLQDQLRIDDRWVLLGSVRYDQAETDNVNRTTGTTQRADDDQVSWSGGVMYLGDHGINPYLSYTESFEPQASVDDDGRLYEPLEGEQWEAGVKVAPPGWDGYVTAAVFDLEQRNSLVTTGGGRQEQVGKQTSQGLELEGVGYLTDQLQLTAAYTYTDAEREGGERKSLIPRHQASTWLDYAFQEGALQGLKLGGGVRYIGESTYNDITVSDVTLVDAMASYDFAENWRAQLNVNNLTDKEYVASCDYWCYYGESRSVIGSLSYQW
ncbi:TonB-dependent siderophore receptor [Halomonas caseinilytica]|uniref:TonB-dependent siderophore receptor n=1 Tax=Halomonas caseinilytica TaxID=438744 RepID=UPI0007E5A3B2|nr:TonB-dependent siderophore receptor [Halomonas caseinilytica]SEM38669.1 iron complex outermembrane recepter protein [Halomonas caseinilytica]